MEIDTFISIKEVKKIVHLGTSTIYKYMGQNDFPMCIKIGKKSLWSLKQLTAWLDNKAVAAKKDSAIS
jgi:predicted DNA-binding transcriptional regulator AlpA